MFTKFLGLGSGVGVGRRWTPWLRTNGVSTNGAAAEAMNFDGLGKKVRPGTFGKIKAGEREHAKGPSLKKHVICSDPISADPICPFPNNNDNNKKKNKNSSSSSSSSNNNHNNNSNNNVLWTPACRGATAGRSRSDRPGYSAEGGVLLINNIMKL